jgi:hypothetical protein
LTFVQRSIVAAGAAMAATTQKIVNARLVSPIDPLRGGRCDRSTSLVTRVRNNR